MNLVKGFMSTVTAIPLSEMARRTHAWSRLGYKLRSLWGVSAPSWRRCCGPGTSPASAPGTPEFFYPRPRPPTPRTAAAATAGVAAPVPAGGGLRVL